MRSNKKKCSLKQEIKGCEVEEILPGRSNSPFGFRGEKKEMGESSILNNTPRQPQQLRLAVDQVIDSVELF